MPIELALLLASPGLAIGVGIWAKPRVVGTHPRGDLPKPYPWLASRAEERAFEHLERTFPPPRFIISAHMLLADVVGRSQLLRLCPSDREFCWKAHCDFVIVERSTMNISRVVEVNGPHHQLPAQTMPYRRKSAILRQFGTALDTFSS